MRSTLRLAVFVLASVGSAARAAAQDETPPSTAAPAQDSAPAPGAAPARNPATTARSRRAARRRPIHESVDRVVDSVVEAHMKPCDAARQQGVPCFPVSVEQEGPRFSVAEALRRYRADGRPAPGVPTVSEIQGQMSGQPLSDRATFGSFDPVCIAKKLFGKKAGTTFHLYRTWDARGERPLLTDHLLDPKAYALNPDFHYEYLGKYDGECEAVAAWRAALRKATEPKPYPDDWDEVKGDEPPE